MSLKDALNKSVTYLKVGLKCGAYSRAVLKQGFTVFTFLLLIAFIYYQIFEVVLWNKVKMAKLNF